MTSHRLVLDSFALMAYFHQEAGSKKLNEYLAIAKKKDLELILSRMNWGEVFYSIFRSNGAKIAEEALLLIDQLPIDIIEVSKDQVYAAALLKAKHPIAYADCFAAALAQEKQCPVLTGDPEFKLLKNEIAIEWI